MNKLEELEEEALQQGISVIDYNFDSDRIKGLYCDGTIALNKKLTPIEKTCVLAEEIAHHQLNVGDITDMSHTSNRKQEHKARMRAYNQLANLSNIIAAYKAGCRTYYDMAEYLNVSEAFLVDTLNAYKSYYGEYAIIEDTLIYFEPYFDIKETKENAVKQK